MPLVTLNAERNTEHFLKPTVLLTRPEPAVTRLARAIEQRGFDVLLCPVVELAPSADPVQVRGALGRALPADWIIFVSAAAVTHGLACVPPGGLGDTRIAAPGPGTARALRDAGFATVLAPASEFNSEGLLALREFQQVKGRRVVICNAPGGRDLLARTLRRRGADVREVHVYRRLTQPPPAGSAEAIKRAPALITLITSAAVLSALHDGLERAAWRRLLGQRLMVSSERLAARARDAGFRHVEVIDGADDDSVLAALC